jgi:hypothetical protein
MTLTTSLPGEPSGWGAQRPSVCAIPPYVSSTGAEAVEVCRLAKLYLDPWQEFSLHNALGERPDGKWAAFEVGVEVARQNGKGGILEGRSLVGLFLLGERLIIHSAHEFPTSLEAFRRLLNLIEDTPDFDRRVKRVSRSHGEEGIELKGGQRIRFRTRTKGGGRGFSADCLILDEAMVIPEAMHGALLPTLSARPNPQVWYTGSAVDQESMEHGVVFARLRERALRGDDPALAYFGWSADAESPEQVTEESARDPEQWAKANPGLGIRISLEHVAREQRSMDARTFAVERLGVGDWPDLHAESETLNLAVWHASRDLESAPEGPVAFAFDVRPDRSRSAIGVAGQRSDRLRHVEVVDHRPGTGWVADRIVELTRSHEACEVLCDQGSPAAALVPDIEARGVKVRLVNAQEYVRACGVMFDTVDQGRLRHLGTPELSAAVKGARKRPLGDAWAWSRKSSAVDIAPLVACTLALWRIDSVAESAYENDDLLVV